MSVLDLYKTVGPYLADKTSGTWHPVEDPESDHDLSGHLECDGIWMWFGMGLNPKPDEIEMPDEDEDIAYWLQIAYLYAKLDPSELGNTDACGTGLGTKVVNALQQWVADTGTTLRFIGIENPAFFQRFSWSESGFEYEGDGECWQW